MVCVFPKYARAIELLAYPSSASDIGEVRAGPGTLAP